MKHIILFMLFSVMIFGNCETGKDNMKLEREEYGVTAQGQKIDIYTLSNANGMQVLITNYGAIVQSLTAPDRNGKYEDIVLGYDKLADYLNDSPYFSSNGAVTPGIVLK